MEHFASISLNGWRQFGHINIDLDSNLCVLTGPNGCGKTTILNVLGRHFGWNINFVSTPYLSRRSEKKFWSDVEKVIEQDFDLTPVSQQVGEIRYGGGATCRLLAPQSETAQYALKYEGQVTVPGLNIPSHRPVSSYFRLDSIPTDPKTNQQQFQEFQALLLQVYGAGNSRNPGTVLKQSLMALAVFGFGSEAVQPNMEYQRLFHGFQDVLRHLLPRSLGFQKIEIRSPEIVLITDAGQFPLDAMSGGISAIFGMAWQIYMYGFDKEDCTVLIDEPENHLHPSMQREFLPSLRLAFPNYRFIVATHSPFIVSSAADATVYALLFEENRSAGSTLRSPRKRIYSRRLENVDLAGSPNRILRDVLDVPSTLPVWVELRVRSVLEAYRSKGGDEAAASEAYLELQRLGIVSEIGEMQSPRGGTA